MRSGEALCRRTLKAADALSFLVWSSLGASPGNLPNPAVHECQQWTIAEQTRRASYIQALFISRPPGYISDAVGLAKPGVLWRREEGPREQIVVIWQEMNDIISPLYSANAFVFNCECWKETTDSAVPEEQRRRGWSSKQASSVRSELCT